MIYWSTAIGIILFQSGLAYVSIIEALDTWRTKAVVAGVVTGSTFVLFVTYLWVGVGWSWWLLPWVFGYFLFIVLIEEIENRVRRKKPFT